MPDDPYHRRVDSPDGRFRIDYDLNEGRHSHWIETPEIRDLSQGKTIFSLEPCIWDAQEKWGENGQFTLFVRRYPDAYTLPVHFDVDAGTVRLKDEPEHHKITKAKALIESHFNQQPAVVPAVDPYRQPVPREIRWLQGVGAVAVLGLLAYLLFFF